MKFFIMIIVLVYFRLYFYQAIRLNLLQDEDTNRNNDNNSKRILVQSHFKKAINKNI